MCDGCVGTHMRAAANMDHTLTALEAKNRETRKRMDENNRHMKLYLNKYKTVMPNLKVSLIDLSSTGKHSLNESNWIQKKLLNLINLYFDSINAQIIEHIQTKIDGKRRK